MYGRDILSGEWQLLSIARAAAADPAVLLLDEITANLDAETEARVREALRQASRGRTVLSVSHRIYESLGGRTVEIRPQGQKMPGVQPRRPWGLRGCKKPGKETVDSADGFCYDELRSKKTYFNHQRR